MRSLIFVEPHKLEWQDRPEPRLQGRGEALVRPVVGTSCDIDRALIDGVAPLPGGFAIGHEAVCEVVDVGDDHTGLHPGQQVIVPYHISCGRCDRCRSGRLAYCRSVPPLAMYGLPVGGDWGAMFDDLVRIPYADSMLIPVPPTVDPIDAVSLGDNGVIGVELVAPHLQRMPGARVLVIGGVGYCSIACVEAATRLGASRVLYVEAHDDRRALGERLGAEVHPGPPTPDLGEFELLVDASFNPEWLYAAIACLGPGGICESTGAYFEDLTLPMFLMYQRDITFRIRRANPGTYAEQALAMVEDGRAKPSDSFSGTFRWDDAPEVLAEPHLKPVFLR